MSSDVARPSGPLPMFPLSGVLFPHAPLTLHVFEPRYRQLTADCLAGDRQLGIVLITRGSEVGGNDQRSMVGTLARIEEAAPVPDGRWYLLLSGLRRIAVSQWLVDDPYPRAMVEEIDEIDEIDEGPAAAEVPDDPPSPEEGSTTPGLATPGHPLVAEALAAVRLARGLLSETGRAPALQVSLADLAVDPAVAAWQLCHLAPVGPLDRQRLLETPTVSRRLELVTRLSTETADDLQRMLAGG